MPSKPLVFCTYPGCDQRVGSGRCITHRTHAEQARGSAAARGYGYQHRVRFRTGVLARDVTCTYPGCDQPSQDADHYPLSRRQLVAAGFDPNDPAYGRGLCHRHHSQSTAREQPGGFRIS